MSDGVERRELHCARVETVRLQGVEAGLVEEALGGIELKDRIEEAELGDWQGRLERGRCLENAKKVEGMDELVLEEVAKGNVANHRADMCRALCNGQPIDLRSKYALAEEAREMMEGPGQEEGWKVIFGRESTSEDQAADQAGLLARVAVEQLQVALQGGLVFPREGQQQPLEEACSSNKLGRVGWRWLVRFPWDPTLIVLPPHDGQMGSDLRREERRAHCLGGIISPAGSVEVAVPGSRREDVDPTGVELGGLALEEDACGGGQIEGA